MTTPKVSVIIPVYNVAEYLVQCLHSVLTQSLEELEILCVNDGSTDGSLEILQEYANKDPRISILSQENQGLSQARNVGASMATGEYLFFLDSDDWLETGALELLYHRAEESQVDIVYFSGRVHWEGEIPHQEQSLHLHRPALLCDGVVRTACQQFEHAVTQHAVLPFAWLQFFKRSYYQQEQLRFYPDIYYEDNLFTFQSLFTAKRTICLSQELYHYRKRGGSITRGRSTNKSYESYLTVFLGCLLTLKAQKLPKKTERIYRHFLEEIRSRFAYHYDQVHGEGKVFVREMLLNLEKIYCSELPAPVEQQGFCDNRKDYPELCFFGSGLHCQLVLDFFANNDLEFPVAICDNAPEKQGIQIRGIHVISFDQALERYGEIAILITNQNYYEQILQQVEAVLPPHRILRLDL